jgi:Leucine-rich repeat (LRR) protein
MINNLKKSEMKIMSYNCSDAILTISNSRYFLNLLTNKNFFFKPEFKLKKKEIRKIENEILIMEGEFWRN